MCNPNRFLWNLADYGNRSRLIQTSSSSLSSSVVEIVAILQTQRAANQRRDPEEPGGPAATETEGRPGVRT